MSTLGTVMVIIGASTCLGALFESINSDDVTGIKAFMLGIVICIIGCCLVGAGI